MIDTHPTTILPLKGPSLFPSAGRAESIVVFIHGYGANGDDLIGVSSLWAPYLNTTAFLSPHAPFACEEIPFGRQWFSLGSWNPERYGEPDVDELVVRGVTQALPHLNAYIDGVLHTAGLPEDRLALVGFSQGAMMALSAAYARQKPCAAVIGYSGGFTTGAPLSVISPCPTLLVHGSEDPVIPIAAMEKSVKILKMHAVPTETLRCDNLGHSVSDQGWQKGAEFLVRHLQKS